MLKKLFVTDCEGPLTLNDNAYELSKEFIPNGEEFFRIISLFDNYLVDVIKKQDYNAGNTLKLIAPFLKAHGVNNEDIVKFSKENIFFVDNASNTIKLATSLMDSFIVSTSYGQYIEAVCNSINFPFENTYYTLLDIDSFEILDEDIERLFDLRKIIHEIAIKEKQDNILDVDRLNEIFFEEIPSMNISKLTDSVVCIGGILKQKAVEEILSNFNLEKKSLMFVGDSHTDIEPLKFAKENGGIAISFNGHESALREAEIAIISKNTITTSLLIDLHSKFNKNYVLEFVKSYSSDPKKAFENFKISFALITKFNDIFPDKNFPIIKLITQDNLNELVSKSMKMRKKIRGKNIGSLG